MCTFPGLRTAIFLGNSESRKTLFYDAVRFNKQAGQSIYTTSAVTVTGLRKAGLCAFIQKYTGIHHLVRHETRFNCQTSASLLLQRRSPHGSNNGPSRKRQMFLTDVRFVTTDVHQPGPQKGHLFHAAFVQNIAPLVVTGQDARIELNTAFIGSN